MSRHTQKNLPSSAVPGCMFFLLFLFCQNLSRLEVHHNAPFEIQRTLLAVCQNPHTENPVGLHHIQAGLLCRLPAAGHRA